MPWKIEEGHDGCPDGKPFAVVKKSDGSVAGCHASEADAKAQLAALYANEPSMSDFDEGAHPRDEHGRFGDKGGGSDAGEAKYPDVQSESTSVAHLKKGDSIMPPDSHYEAHDRLPDVTDIRTLADRPLYLDRNERQLATLRFTNGEEAKLHEADTVERITKFRYGDGEWRDPHPTKGTAMTLVAATAAEPELGTPFNLLLCVEGLESSDHRLFELGTTSWRELPIPFMVQDTTAHGPGQEPEPAWAAGQIDNIWRDPEDPTRIMGRARYLADEAGQKAERLARGAFRGVSIDGYFTEPPGTRMQLTHVDLAGEPVAALTRYDGTVISRVTQVPTPALEPCQIWFDDEDMPELTAMAHGGVVPTDTEPTIVEMGFVERALKSRAASLRSVALEWDEEKHPRDANGKFGGDGGDGGGGDGKTPKTEEEHLKVAYDTGYETGKDDAASGAPFGDESGSGAWASEYAQESGVQYEDLLASFEEGYSDGFYEKDDPSAAQRFTNDFEALVASGGGPLNPPKEWFFTPEPDHRQPMTVDADGHIYGHLAGAKQCHIGYEGVCRTAPASETTPPFKGFHRTSVDCADGSKVACGWIPLDTDHGPPDERNRWSQEQTWNYYEHSGCLAARVRASNGRHGTWLTGAILPALSERHLSILQGLSVSGHWHVFNDPDDGRPYPNELLAVLGGVPYPGFPETRTDLLVASGQLVGMIGNLDPVFDCACGGTCAHCQEGDPMTPEETAAFAAQTEKIDALERTVAVLVAAAGPEVAAALQPDEVVAAADASVEDEVEEVAAAFDPTAPLTVDELAAWSMRYDHDARKAMAADGRALRDLSYAIDDEDDLRLAIRAGAPAEHIARNAERLGLANLIPTPA